MGRSPRRQLHHRGIGADGVLDTMVDGTKTIREVAERAWLVSAWRKENRVAETPAALRDLHHREPLTSAHKAWLKAPQKHETIVN